ncbi:MAG: glycosyltransferase family 39 protein [Prolixibacteraceae bacterium]|nr:glycosyltransferase family 39 protein [Prolixibacteraceae bacterium]
MMHRLTKNNNIRYILYLVAVLPVFIFRDFTPDNELRYLSIADEALRNGSVFTFTNHGLIYADKPPLYLWIVMSGKVIFGYHNLLFLGLFSFLPALVVVRVMDRWVKSTMPDNDRIVAQLMLLTSAFFLGTALVVRMDMLMCMFIVLALYTFFRMYSGAGKRRDPVLFPLFVFLALFSKGPIGVIVPLISIAVFLYLKGDIRTIGKYWGWKTILILLTLCGAWFAGVFAEGGSLYLNNLLFNQTVNRAVNSFHHKEPFYFYFVTIWYSLAPWSLLTIGTLVTAFRKKPDFTDLERFFLVIVLSTLTILSLFSSKLPVYMLPVFPFLVYLSVLRLTKIGSARWTLILAGIPAVILCMALPGIIAAFQLSEIGEQGISPLIILTGIILSGSGVVALKYLIRQQLNQGIITISTGMLLAVFSVSFAIPKYNSLIGLNLLCNQAKETALEKGAQNYYYCEMNRADNLDVYLGTTLKKLRISELYKPDSPIKKPAILFTWDKAIERNDSLQVFIKGKEVHQKGSYYYIVIEK